MSDIVERITEYLSVGGLFNPELMPPDKVRDMVITCRAEIESLRNRVSDLNGALRIALNLDGDHSPTCECKLCKPAAVKISRVWAMPSADTFSVKPIREFVLRYLTEDSCDPFARNCELASDRNDLNPNTKAQDHMEATSWLTALANCGKRYSSVLFDPPYSPRQISEAYQSCGLKVGMEETQNARLYSSCRDQIARMVPVGGHVLSFGWNSVGMGINRGFEIVEILLVCHGGAHNDTICLAERRTAEQMSLVA